MAEEKTEKPTPKRRREARRRGEVARTPELGQWLTVLLLSLVIGPLLRHELGVWRELLVACLQATQDPTPALALNLLGRCFRHVFVALLALGSAVMVVGVLASLAQGGFFLAPRLVKPSAAKLNPVSGLKRIFGLRAWWEGAKMLLKSSVLALLCWSAVSGVMPMVGGLVPIPVVLDEVSDRSTALLRNAALAALVLAAADYAVARRRTAKQTRMTRHEVKQEYRQSEGDPLVKSAIRSRQLAAARNRMLADVAEADVLLVNPTHVAVALRYHPERGAPRVVARGAGVIAARLRERAEEARVPMVQDVPLARALYRSCEVGQEIPRELFAAVAQVLAFVISRRTQGQHGGRHDSPRGDAEVPAVPPAIQRRREGRRDPSTASAAGR